MKKSILLAVALMVFVGAAAIGATGAFFSDTETSTGNTFTAGAIDLKVDSQQHYNGATCVPNDNPQIDAAFVWDDGAKDGFPVKGTPCDGTWSETDLGPSNHFFNFGDVKPGDQGENTVSLHVINNPAYACLDITTTSNEENGINEPEATAGDVTSGAGEGELAGNVHFQTWLDEGATPGFQGPQNDPTEGDNIWQVGEPALAAGALSDLIGSPLHLALADSVGGTPIDPAETNYVGLFWCAGTVTGGAGTLGCDGSAMNNLSQTDSATADVTFRVEQTRNNPNFVCDPSRLQG